MSFQRVGQCGIFILGIFSASAIPNDVVDGVIRRDEKLQAGISTHTSFGDNVLKPQSQEIEVNSQGNTRSIKSEDAVIHSPKRNGVLAASITASGEIERNEEDPAEDEEAPVALVEEEAACERNTGGTCRFLYCDGTRNSHCSGRWSYKCECRGNTCAKHGECVAPTPSPTRFPTPLPTPPTPAPTPEPTPAPTAKPTPLPTPSPTPPPCREPHHMRCHSNCPDRSQCRKGASWHLWGLCKC